MKRLFTNSPAVKHFGWLVSCCGFCFAIALLLFLSTQITFAPIAPTKVISAITMAGYPKFQDTLFYLGATFGVGIVVALTWMIWFAFAHLLSRIRKVPLESALLPVAFCFLPLSLGLLSIVDVQQSVNWVVVPFFGTIGLIVLRLLLKQTFPTLRSSDFQSCRHGSHHGNPSRAFSLLSQVTSFVVLPVLLYFSLWHHSVHGPIDFFHEGERLAPLNEFLHDGIPYRDVYLQHGLIQNALLPLLAAKVFSPTLAGTRTIDNLFGPLPYVALYLLGMQLFRRKVFSSLLLVFIVSSGGHWLGDRASLGILAAVCIAHWIQIEKRGAEDIPPVQSQSWLILSGVFTSAAFFWSSDVGAFTFVGLILFFMTQCLMCRASAHSFRKNIEAYLCGVVFVFLPVLISFALLGCLKDFLGNTYLQFSLQSDVWGLPMPPLETVLGPLCHMTSAAQFTHYLRSENFEWLLCFLVLSIGAAFVAHAVLHQSSSEVLVNSQVALLFCLSFVNFRTALGRPDTGHLMAGGFYLWGLILFSIERAGEQLVSRVQDGRKLSVDLRALWFLPVAYIIGWHLLLTRDSENYIRRRFTNIEFMARNSIARTREDQGPDGLNIGSARIPHAQSDLLRNVVTYIQAETLPEDSIYNFSNSAAYYFFAQRRSASRYFLPAYAATPELQHNVIDSLDRQQTKLVMYRSGPFWDSIDGISNEQRLPILARYLHEHYHLAQTFDDVELLLRNDLTQSSEHAISPKGH